MATFWVIVWYILSLLVGREIILPSPISVILKLTVLGKTASFYLSCLMSILRITIGLLSGTVFGILLAVLTTRSKLFDKLISPALSVIRSTPVASFILMAFFWIGQEIIPIFISFLMVTPIIWNSVVLGIRSVDRELSEMCRVMQFSTRKKLKLLYIPTVFPSFASGFKNSLGLAWKAGISAEVICSAIAYGIGSSLQDAKVYLETTELFAWTVTVVIISLILEKIFAKITDRSIKRYTVMKEVNNEN